jgi:hypothetical protein
MITFDELAALWLRRVVPKEAERGAIGLQMVASSSQKKRVYTVVGGRDRAGHPVRCRPIPTRSSLDQIASFGPCPPSILLVPLFVGVVSAQGLRGGGLVGGPTRHQDRVHRAPVHRAPVNSGRQQRRCGRRGVPAVAHLLHSTSCSPSWVRMHHATSPANVHVHPPVFTSTAEVKSVPLKIKCILQGMQGSKL